MGWYCAYFCPFSLFISMQVVENMKFMGVVGVGVTKPFGRGSLYKPL